MPRATTAYNRNDVAAPRAGARPGPAGLPARGAPDAGAVIRGAHPACLLRRRLPGARARDGVARPPPRRQPAAGAGPALVEGDDRRVRDRRRDRDDPVVRARPAVAAVHGHLRRRVRAGLRARGLLVLPRGDLPGYLRLRLGPDLAG